jgi:hypothetical protein
MESLDKDGRSLEVVVTELLKEEDLELISDPGIRVQVKIQKLRGEMRKYLSRPTYYKKQIKYIRGIIKEIEQSVK